MSTPSVSLRIAWIVSILSFLLLGQFASAQAPSLSLASGSALKGTSLSLNLSLSAATNAPASLQWTVSYPPAAVSSVSIAAGSALTSAGDTLTCAPGSGTLTCMATGMNVKAISSGVVAVDDDERALAALRSAAATPGLKPVEAERRDLFRRPLIADELQDYDAVVFDPPRQGAEAQARELGRSRVAQIVAVSCNPATFARDAAILVNAGCRLSAVTPVDQFRYAAHVEIVAQLER